MKKTKKIDVSKLGREHKRKDVTRATARREPRADAAVTTATSAFIRKSARKIRLVADAVKHLSPQRALSVLPFMDQKAEEPVRKIIRQAMADATNNLKLAAESLSRMQIEVQEGPTMKRYQFGSRGRVNPIKKRTSRIVVRLYAGDNEKNRK